MSNTWAKNPYNMEDSLKKHALPEILFQDCKSNCVDFEFAAPTSDNEIKCVKNCQAKTYAAFDMFMRVQYNFAKNETYRDHVDVSNFTGMEIEHGGNTGDMFQLSKHGNLGHFDPNANSQNSFVRVQRHMAKGLGDLKNSAGAM